MKVTLFVVSVLLMVSLGVNVYVGWDSANQGIEKGELRVVQRKLNGEYRVIVNNGAFVADSNTMLKDLYK